MPENLVKLTDIDNVHYASSQRRYPNWLAADLTQQEVDKLTPMVQQIANSPRDRLLAGHLPAERLEGLFSPDGLGYLPPDKVRRFFIGELSQEFEGGLLHQVVIDFKDSWQNGRIGAYTYWSSYGENNIPQGISAGQKGLSFGHSGYDVLSGPVLADDEPATEYILEDRAGKFVPISEKWIESLILEARQSAERIGTFSPDAFVFSKLERAEKLAKATESQDLIQLVNAAWAHHESLVAKGPERHKEALRQRSIYTGTPRYQVELSGALEQSWQEGMEEYDAGGYKITARRRAGRSGIIIGVDPNQFPYSLESLSTQAVVELMKHFAVKEFDLDYIQEHMKTKKIG